MINAQCKVSRDSFPLKVPCQSCCQVDVSMVDGVFFRSAMDDKMTESVYDLG